MTRSAFFPRSWLLGLSLPVVACASPAGPGEPSAGAPSGGEPAAASNGLFELRVGFWINLHHFLYEQAKDESTATGRSGAGWDAALAYYRAKVVDKDLLFNLPMRAIDDGLSEAGDAATLDGSDIDAELRAELEAAAPIYRAAHWPAHRAACTRWIDALRPLLTAHGGALARRLSGVFEHEWPEQPVRVDVLCYANWAGAYTSVGPAHIRISALDEDMHDPFDALESLFHEASHLLVPRAGAVVRAIDAASTRRERPAPRDLWHVLIFYTVGDAMRRLPDAPADFRPYGERTGLYARSPVWAKYREVCEECWQPYLDGQGDLDAAIDRTIEKLDE
jgi:hypothetical protein